MIVAVCNRDKIRSSDKTYKLKAMNHLKNFQTISNDKREMFLQHKKLNYLSSFFAIQKWMMPIRLLSCV